MAECDGVGNVRTTVQVIGNTPGQTTGTATTGYMRQMLTIRYTVREYMCIGIDALAA